MIVHQRLLKNEQAYEFSAHYNYKPDVKGNLKEITNEAGHVLGRYNYECE